MINNSNTSILIKNKDVLQSYIITTAKYNFSVYEKRILYWIINDLQKFLKNKKLNFESSIEEKFAREQVFYMPISAVLLNEEDEHYNRIKKAIASLEGKKIFYENEKVFEIVRLVLSPKVKKYKRIIEFTLHPRIYEALLNFSKGFRKYELETAISLKSVYSMRFYELFSEQKNTMTYSIETLKSMFKVVDKYSLTKNFINRVVIPAQKELNRSAPYSFTFIQVKTGKKITALTFTPVYHVKNRDETLEAKALQSKVDLYWSISDKSKTILQDEYSFTTTELKRHAKLLERAEKELNLPMELTKIKENALKATNPKGYIIISLKNMIKVSENSNNSITPKFVKKTNKKN